MPSVPSPAEAYSGPAARPHPPIGKKSHRTSTDTSSSSSGSSSSGGRSRTRTWNSQSSDRNGHRRGSFRRGHKRICLRTDRREPPRRHRDLIDARRDDLTYAEVVSLLAAVGRSASGASTVIAGRYHAPFIFRCAAVELPVLPSLLASVVAVVWHDGVGGRSHSLVYPAVVIAVKVCCLNTVAECWGEFPGVKRGSAGVLLGRGTQARSGCVCARVCEPYSCGSHPPVAS
ncbi:uncharacterized protein LOC111585826 [Amphiprion ocellaris]|uniref:uncharacterized protein LOC111585826 n=1 Tax=Amphiprion ocellaris TaxID=80972 RepID=UPI001649D68B|nr:uncharacterized protein LOC111585826 [Amphiprion ocellaris]